MCSACARTEFAVFRLSTQEYEIASMTDTKSSVRKSQWVWPRIPANQTQFEEMMQSLDAHLASEGRLPAQRPLEAARLLSMTLGYSGKPLLPVERIQTQSPYDSGWCIKAAWDWFEQV